jgi:hypothetical protein
MPIPTALLPGIIQGVTAIGQLGVGAMMKADRPEYEIADSAKNSLALARAKFQSPFTAGYSQAKKNIDLATANKIQAAGQYGNAQESLAGIMGQEGKMLRDLSTQDAMQRERDLQNYQGELSEMAKLEEAQFFINEFGPYQDKFNEKRHMVGAGLENLYGATDTYATADMLGALTPLDSNYGAGNRREPYNVNSLSSGVISTANTAANNYNNFTKLVNSLKGWW